MQNLVEKLGNASIKIRAAEPVKGEEAANAFEAAANYLSTRPVLASALPLWLINLLMSLIPIVVEYISKLITGTLEEDEEK